MQALANAYRWAVDEQEKAAVLCLSMKGNFLFQTLNMSPSLPLPFLNSPTGFWVSHCWMVA
jgi:hypothetical protein